MNGPEKPRVHTLFHSSGLGTTGTMATRMGTPWLEISNHLVWRASSSTLRHVRHWTHQPPEPPRKAPKWVYVLDAHVDNGWILNALATMFEYVSTFLFQCHGHCNAILRNVVSYLRYPVLLGPFIVYSFWHLVRLPQSYFWSSVGLCLCLCFDCLHPLGITQNSPFQSLPSVPSPLNRPPRRHFDIWHMFVLDILEIRLAFWNPISTWWHIVSNILWCLLWPNAWAGVF